MTLGPRGQCETISSSQDPQFNDTFAVEGDIFPGFGNEDVDIWREPIIYSLKRVSGMRAGAELN